MKIQITEKGVNDTKGNLVPIGTILEVAGDTIPAWLINKAVPHGDDDAEIITGKTMSKKEQAALMKERVGRALELNIEVDSKWTLEELNAAIATAESLHSK